MKKTMLLLLALLLCFGVSAALADSAVNLVLDSRAEPWSVALKVDGQSGPTFGADGSCPVNLSDGSHTVTLLNNGAVLHEEQITVSGAMTVSDLLKAEIDAALADFSTDSYPLEEAQPKGNAAYIRSEAVSAARSQWLESSAVTMSFSLGSLGSESQSTVKWSMYKEDGRDELYAFSTGSSGINSQHISILKKGYYELRGLLPDGNTVVLYFDGSMSVVEQNDDTTYRELLLNVYGIDAADAWLMGIRTDSYTAYHLVRLSDGAELMNNDSMLQLLVRLRGGSMQSVAVTFADNASAGTCELWLLPNTAATGTASTKDGSVKVARVTTKATVKAMREAVEGKAPTVTRIKKGESFTLLTDSASVGVCVYVHQVDDSDWTRPVYQNAGFLLTPYNAGGQLRLVLTKPGNGGSKPSGGDDDDDDDGETWNPF